MIILLIAHSVKSVFGDTKCVTSLKGLNAEHYQMDRLATEWTATLGNRLRAARLNRNMTQSVVGEAAGLSRKTVINAEKGQASLEVFVALLIALGEAEQLNNFLPPQTLSPIQLLKLRGKQRQRASRSTDPDPRATQTW